MTWADRRKHVIEAILIACAIAIIALVAIPTLYKTPSCLDGKQNQGEQGVDCGGPCPYACSVAETPPAVRFARAVSPQSGRTDLIAYIDNSNSNAELQNAKYAAELYDLNGRILAQKTGTITIPPSTTEPLFIPDFYQGSAAVTQAFVTLDSSSYKWLRTAKPIIPIPDNIQIQSTNTPTPKITAQLRNTTAQTMMDATVVAVVFNSENNAIAASQTVIQNLAPQSSMPIIFTWNEPFSSAPARVEILPVTPSAL